MFAMFNILFVAHYYLFVMFDYLFPVDETDYLVLIIFLKKFM